MSAKADRIPDYKSPIILTNMIESRGDFKKHPVFAHTDFDKSREYLHIMPHDESHGIRRKAILEKYGPQIKALMTKDYRSAIVAASIAIIQILLASYSVNLSWPYYLALLYIVGATLNHTEQVMIHDLTHYTAFENWNLNRVFAVFATLPTCLPSAITFGKYHWEHHQNMGNPHYDADLPTEWEIKTFNTPLLKIVFVFCHPLFYAFRPLFTKPKALTAWEGINWIVVICFDIWVYTYLGPWALAYLFGCTWFSMGFHPAGAHTIAEHYEFVKGQESYNYKGIWNFFNINLGYHIEHHDFPAIPCWNLHKVAEIAPEYYDCIPYHTSYLAVIWNYIFDKNIGAFSRIDITDLKATKKQQ